MTAYRSAPSGPRVVHAHFADLPEPLRRALISSRRDADVAPYAISLRGRGRPALALLGALIGAAAYPTYVIQGGGRLISSDGATFVITLAVLSATLFVYGVVSSLHSMPLRLHPQALLLPPRLLCTTGIGSNVDVIPLSLVERVVPAQGALEVVMREGEVRRYPMQFALGMKSFFDAIHRALSEAPEAEAEGSPVRASKRPSAAMPLVVALIVGPLVGGTAGLVAVAESARGERDLLHAVLESGLAEASDDAARVDHYEYFFREVGTDREIGGLPGWMFEHVTDIDELEAEMRPRYEEARAASATLTDAADASTIDSTSDLGTLRRLATAHAEDALGPRALARIASRLDRARADAAAGGATPARLALCDGLVSTARSEHRGAIQIRVERADGPATREFEHEGWSSTPATVSDGFDAIDGGVREALTQALHDALDASPETRDGDPLATITVTLHPGSAILVYTTENTQSHEVRDDYTLPNLAADVRVVVSGPSGVIESSASYEAVAETMAPEHMAEAYPGPSELYAAEGRDLGRQIAGALASALCLP